MKKYIFFLSASILCSMLFTSCIVYHPHNVDIPLLNEPGTLHADASISMTGPLMAAPAINATVAYAPVNMLALQAAASVTNAHSYYMQAAGGTYFPFGLSVLECYIGYGHGYSHTDTIRNLNHETHRVEGPYNIVFSQINFGWADLDDGCIDVGFGLKGGLLIPKWDKIRLESDGTETLIERHDQPHFLLEPQLMFRFGWEKFKFSINASFSFLDSWPTENNYFNYERFGVGLGIHYEF